MKDVESGLQHLPTGVKLQLCSIGERFISMEEKPWLEGEILL